LKILKSIRHDPAFGIAPKVMRREFLNSGTRRGGSDHLPHDFGCHASSPDPACFEDRPKERAFGDATSLLPFIDRTFTYDGIGTDWIESTRSASNSTRRNPHPISIAIIA
jgi:hypothetical protein